MEAFSRILGFIAQGAINIDRGITNIEKDSPVHRAMNDLCRLAQEGRVDLTEEGKRIEREDSKGDVEFWFNEWNDGHATHFAARLFDLISEADSDNLKNIERGFPLFVAVFNERMGK